MGQGSVYKGQNQERWPVRKRVTTTFLDSVPCIYTKVQLISKQQRSLKRKPACDYQVRLKRFRCGEPRLLDTTQVDTFLAAIAVCRLDDCMICSAVRLVRDNDLFSYLQFSWGGMDKVTAVHCFSNFR